MEQIFVHDGHFGEQALGTRAEFRSSLDFAWSDWHRDEDTSLSLDEYVEQSLDAHLIVADEWDLCHIDRIQLQA